MATNRNKARNISVNTSTGKLSPHSASPKERNVIRGDSDNKYAFVSAQSAQEQWDSYKTQRTVFLGMKRPIITTFERVLNKK